LTSLSEHRALLSGQFMACSPFIWSNFKWHQNELHYVARGTINLPLQNIRLWLPSWHLTEIAFSLSNIFWHFHNETKREYFAQTISVTNWLVQYARNFSFVPYLTYRRRIPATKQSMRSPVKHSPVIQSPWRSSMWRPYPWGSNTSLNAHSFEVSI